MKIKLFSAIILLMATCILTIGCAHNEITNYDNNMDQLEQKALNAPDGKAYVRVGAKFNAKIGGKHAGVINAPADVTWEEVKKIMGDERRLYSIFKGIPFLKSVDVAVSSGKNFETTYNYKTFFVPISLSVGSYNDEQKRLLTGNKTGGSFLSFVLKNIEHDIGVIPIDDDKSLLVVRYLESYMFPANIDAGIFASMIGLNKKVCPEMTSAFIDEVKAGVQNRR